MSREDYLACWSQRHDGIEPAGLVSGWLVVSYLLARPFVAARIPPDVLTLAGVATAASACWPASVGGRWLLLAAGGAAVAALLDGVDGAVAVTAGRDGRWGSVLDSVADRVTDALLLLALYLAGAPAWAAVAALVLTVTLEYARSRAASAGAAGLPLTLGERPGRVAVAGMFLLAAGIFPDSAALWVGTGAYLTLALAILGTLQLVLAARRALSRGRSGPPDEGGDGLGGDADEG